MDLNRSAQILRKELLEIGVDVSHTRLLGMVAKAGGFADYNSSQLKNYDAHFRGVLALDAYTDQWGLEIKAKDDCDAKEQVKDMIENCSVFLVGHNEPITDIEGADWWIGINDHDVKKDFNRIAVMELLED